MVLHPRFITVLYIIHAVTVSQDVTHTLLYNVVFDTKCTTSFSNADPDNTKNLIG